MVQAAPKSVGRTFFSGGAGRDRFDYASLADAGDEIRTGESTVTELNGKI